ncbi:MAG: SpoIIE family protein phosphatase [Clostridia bacterium]|nr:SpoIIE family protein phosphatase [Clostridia bacterium]
MQRYKRTDILQISLYLLFGAGMLFLRFVGNTFEPFSLALAYALPYAGVSPIPVALLFFLTSCIGQGIFQVLLALGQAVLLATSFLIHNKLRYSPKVKTGFIPLLALSLSLGGFVAFSPFTPYRLPFSLVLGEIAQKVLVAAFIFLLFAVFAVALNALMKKFLKCRLKMEELIFCVVFFVFIGLGIGRLLGLNAYLGIAFFILLVFSYVTKDASSFLCAFVLSLPPALSYGFSVGRFFIYAVAATLFSKTGRLPSAFALLAVFFLFGYVDGLYAYPAQTLVSAILSAVIPALLFVLFPAPLLRTMENKLVFYREKHLSRVAINRNRSAIGKQLFEIASVFRDIETTFSTLGSGEAETGAKEFIRSCVVEESCKNCPQFRLCARKEVLAEIDKLVNVGCLKNKVSLIDVPKRLADTCVNQSNILYAVNRHLADYRKYMTETENAASGRTLLAGQAQGVSEILRSLALEQSEPLRIYTDKERALNVALLKAGVVCSEVLIYGDEQNPTLSLITFGRADVKKIARIASELFKTSMMISERITLSQDKYCCILRKKPYFDAAFGVASAKKAGETASGDTHSVIKIDERRFMVALSDGMGSGEYARRISESTISLLESFYRAKMPSETVLPTINKLLTFNKEESFACVDIAVVDLDDGRADVVKIGSPVGFILSGSTVKVLEGESLPLGILDSIHPDATSYDLQENDVLLFLSDGITGAFGSTSDLYETLKTVPIHNPQQLADSLLERALQAYGGVAKDDMTAVAVRLFKSPCAA